MNHFHSNLTVLPAITPENVFEPIVNRHHAEVRFRDARRAEATPSSAEEFQSSLPGCSCLLFSAFSLAPVSCRSRERR